MLSVSPTTKTNFQPHTNFVEEPPVIVCSTLSSDKNNCFNVNNNRKAPLIVSRKNRGHVASPNAQKKSKKRKTSKNSIFPQTIINNYNKSAPTMDPMNDPVHLCILSSGKLEAARAKGNPDGDMRRLVLVQNFMKTVYRVWENEHKKYTSANGYGDDDDSDSESELGDLEEEEEDDDDFILELARRKKREVERKDSGFFSTSTGSFIDSRNTTSNKPLITFDDDEVKSLKSNMSSSSPLPERTRSLEVSIKNTKSQPLALIKSFRKPFKLKKPASSPCVKGNSDPDVHTNNPSSSPQSKKKPHHSPKAKTKKDNVFLRGFKTKKTSPASPVKLNPSQITLGTPISNSPMVRTENTPPRDSMDGYGPTVPLILSPTDELIQRVPFISLDENLHLSEESEFERDVRLETNGRLFDIVFENLKQTHDHKFTTNSMNGKGSIYEHDRSDNHEIGSSVLTLGSTFDELFNMSWDI